MSTEETRTDQPTPPPQPALTPELQIAIRDHLAERTKFWFSVVGIPSLLGVAVGLLYTFFILPKEAVNKASDSILAESRQEQLKLREEYSRNVGKLEILQTQIAGLEKDFRQSQQQYGEILKLLLVYKPEDLRRAQQFLDYLSKSTDASNFASALPRLAADITAIKARIENGLVFQEKKVEDWHLAESDGFALVAVGGEGADALVYANSSQKDDIGLSRDGASNYNSSFIIVRKGEYFKARKTRGPGSVTLHWIPLFAKP